MLTDLITAIDKDTDEKTSGFFINLNDPFAATAIATYAKLHVMMKTGADTVRHYEEIADLVAKETPPIDPKALTQGFLDFVELMLKKNAEKEEEKTQPDKYRSHKEVTAYKILDVIRIIDGTGKLLLAKSTEDDHQIRVSNGFMIKHRPQVGGYYVIYTGGYKSYSPACVFEEGYTEI